MRKLLVATFCGALVLASACGPSTPEVRNSAGTAPPANTNADAPVSFEPGTPQYALTHQPDFAATVKFETGAAKFDTKVVKKGDAWRIEQPTPGLGTAVYHIRSGQPTLVLLPEKKQYFELGTAEETSLANPVAKTLENLSSRGVKIDEVGKETVDGHPSTKYRANRPGEDAEMFLYTADDLQNLLVRLEGRRENVAFRANWTDVTLNPPDSALQPPDLSSWTKIDASAFGGQFSAGGNAAPPPGTPPAPTQP
jgi:hypothetical protein